MSEMSPPSSAAPTTSVIIDSNAKMPATNRGLIGALVVAAVLVAAFVVWLVAAGDDGPYEPGPVAKALVTSFEKSGAKVELSDQELRCVDDKGRDIDPKVFENESIDVFGSNSGRPADETLTAIGIVFDDCVRQASRVSLFAASFNGQSSDITDEQATCLGTAIDKAFTDAGGYRKVFSQGEQAMVTIVMSTFGSLLSCGVDLSTMGGQ